MSYGGFSIPLYLNAWMILLGLGWVIRVFILPYLTSRRTGRRYQLGVVIQEERQTFTLGERAWMMAHHVFTLCGFIGFAISVYLIMTKMRHP